MNTDADFPTLLRELFQGNSRQLCALLRPLTAEQRRALFAEFKDLLKVLKRACRFRADAKGVGLSELYRAIRNDPATFLRDRADTLAEQGALNNTQLMRQFFYSQLMEFYNRLELLQVGLAGKGGIAGVFRHSEQYPVWCAQFILHAGRVLLDRPEPWVQDALVQVFSDLEQRTRFAGADLGVVLLLCEARQRHPDWAAALAPHLGRAVRRDGFFNRKLDDYGSDMILAGLEYAPPSGDLASFEPLMDPKIVEALLKRVADGRLSRADLVALTLRKLQSPLRPGMAKTWLEFQQRLALNDTEIREHIEAFISLLNAPAPVAIKLVLAIVEKHFLADADRAEELIGALGYLLQNPVQTLAKSALRLLKKLSRSRPDLNGSVLNAAVAGLGSPHAALRIELARWLGAFPRPAWSEDALEALQGMAVGLPLAEQTPIAPLLRFAGGDLVEAFRVKVLHQTPDTPENTAFRLFNAVLRCRFGLADAGMDRQAVSFTQGLAPKGGWLSRAFSWSSTGSLPFAELLFAPQPVTVALAEEAHRGIDGLFICPRYPLSLPVAVHPGASASA